MNSPSPCDRKGTFGRSLSGENLSSLTPSPGSDSPGPGAYDSPSGRKTPCVPSTRSHQVAGFVTAARKNVAGAGFVRSLSAGRVSLDSDDGAARGDAQPGVRATGDAGQGRRACTRLSGPKCGAPEYGTSDGVGAPSGRASIDQRRFERLCFRNIILKQSPRRTTLPDRGTTIASGPTGAGAREAGGAASVAGRKGEAIRRLPARRGPGLYYPRDTIVRRSHNVTAR